MTSFISKNLISQFCGCVSVSKQAKKHFFLGKLWSFCCVYATILWTELKFLLQKIQSRNFNKFNFSSNLQPQEKRIVFEFSAETQYTSPIDFLSKNIINIRKSANRRILQRNSGERRIFPPDASNTATFPRNAGIRWLAVCLYANAESVVTLFFYSHAGCP